MRLLLYLRLSYLGSCEPASLLFFLNIQHLNNKKYNIKYDIREICTSTFITLKNTLF